MKKRLERRKEFVKKGLSFIELKSDDKEFFWEDVRKELLEEPKFQWY